jgi:hypothetical protein
MLTPRALSAGGAFIIECPALDVLCHRMGTVYETSGFRRRLADSGNLPLSRAIVGPKPALTPAVRTALAPNGLKTVLLTIQNVFRRISELIEFYPASRCYRPGCPREASNTAYPFARHFHVSVFSPRPPVKGCLGSCRARPRFSVRAFQRHTAVTKDTSDRRLQSHISKMSTRASRGYQPAYRSFPRCVPMNDAVHAAPSASAGFSIVVPGFLFPVRRMERRASDVPVTTQVSHSLMPVPPERPRPLRHRIA